MKLAALVFVCGTAALAGCARTCPPPAAAQPTTPVSTTRLTSADIAETDFAPLVGKQQRSPAVTEKDAGKMTEQELPKDARPPERHPGGGFSGYK